MRGDKEKGGRERMKKRDEGRKKNECMKSNLQVENTYQIMFLVSILSTLNQKSTSI